MRGGTSSCDAREDNPVYSYLENVEMVRTAVNETSKSEVERNLKKRSNRKCRNEGRRWNSDVMRCNGSIMMMEVVDRICGEADDEESLSLKCNWGKKIRK